MDQPHVVLRLKFLETLFAPAKSGRRFPRENRHFLSVNPPLHFNFARMTPKWE